MNRPIKIYIFKDLFIYLFRSYISVWFKLLAFVREHIWHKALKMGYSIRLELTCAWSLKSETTLTDTHKHIKYQKPIRDEQTKVDPLGEKERKKWPLYTHITKWKLFKLHTQVSSSLTECPICQPCAIYYLWQKQQAGNIQVCKNGINK